MIPFFLTLLALIPAPEPFVIHVVDAETNRGVPLIELRTVNSISFITDSAGTIAFQEPELMNKAVFFTVSGHGYEFRKDGFGFRGTRLTTTPGGSATIKVKRLNIAERLYRLTGEGIYTETVKAGEKPPFAPTTTPQVLGCDSVYPVLYRDKIFWTWGDTQQAKYPLGNFHMTAATTPLPGPKGIDPEKGIAFDYFDDGKGFVKGIAPMPGKGPTWIEALVVLPNKEGRDRLWASYIKVEGLKAYARGLAVFDDDKNVFVKTDDFPLDAPASPIGHIFRQTKNGVEYLYFGHPFPLVRVPATEAAFRDPARYEAYTCLKAGSTIEKPDIDRDPNGKARYAWRKNAPPIDPAAQAKLEASGVLKPDEVLLPIRDRDSGDRIHLHNGTVNWNDYRKKWILIANQQYGKPSFLGEVWYAEADSPLGPWKDAVKIVTHDRMDFYNPKHHAFLDHGRFLYFEGTYTKTFSGYPVSTPRYEYNQIMYKLDLSDARLFSRPAK